MTLNIWWDSKGFSVVFKVSHILVRTHLHIRKPVDMTLPFNGWFSNLDFRGSFPKRGPKDVQSFSGNSSKFENMVRNNTWSTCWNAFKYDRELGKNAEQQHNTQIINNASKCAVIIRTWSNAKEKILLCTSIPPIMKDAKEWRLLLDLRVGWGTEHLTDSANKHMTEMYQILKNLNALQYFNRWMHWLD